MYNIELNLMNIYFNAVTCIYSKYLLLNQEYVLQRRIKTIGHLLLTPTDFVVGTFGCTVLSLNNTVITSFARCYSIHLHIFHHAAYQIQNNQILRKGVKMWVSNLLLLLTYATSEADGIVFLGCLRTFRVPHISSIWRPITEHSPQGSCLSVFKWMNNI